MIITFTPAEFRDRSAAWDRRAKEATTAEDHKMMLYAAAGCRERADEDEAEARQQRSLIRLDDRRGRLGRDRIIHRLFRRGSVVSIFCLDLDS
jgi:hypothetical protein